MEFRRSGQSDGRRRRVVLDEVRSSASHEDGEAEPAAPVRKGRGASAKRYSDSALAENQPRITTILPSRWYTMAAVFFLGLAAIAGLEGVYARLVVNSPDGIPYHLRALDVTAQGSFARWLASALLLGASGLALVVLAVRRHRLDDYRGRYRLWGWVALACLLASVDATVDLRAILGWLLHSVVKIPPIGRGQGTWLVAVLLIGGWGLVRFAWETWQSRLARTFLLMTAGCYSASATLMVGLWSLSVELVEVVAGSTLVLLGHFFAFATILTYARFVHRDAQGLHTKRKKRTKVAKKSAEPQPEAESDSESDSPTRQVGDKSVRVDGAHRVPAPASPALAGKPEKPPVTPSAEIRKGNRPDRRPGSR